MKYDFDKRIDRRNTMSLKYDFCEERRGRDDLLPLWVADMDFATAPGIIEALERMVKPGIYGYSDTKESYFLTLKKWFAKHSGWEVEPEWLIKTPGVVFALAAAVRAFTEEGDGVLIQQPVYYPFGSVIRDNGRVLVNSPLKIVDGHYEMDFADFEAKIVENRVKLFILCNPHNPVGRVWTKEELCKVGVICKKHGVIVVSDEIHQDFIFPGFRHQVFANADPEFASFTVTCTAPSKTFNLAGLQVSNIWIADPDLRAKFQRAIDRTGYSQVGLPGIVACQAAYATGEEWLAQLQEYLNGNLDFFRTYLRENLPQLHLVEPEGTYLLWVDFGKLGLTEEEREELLLDKAKLWLDSGAMFGPDGEGFERFNIACPRATLQDALDRLARALSA
ncbi:MAG: pyridoxal phosphate-dependent aminotransferase [Clostridiales bacterium]|nr:pyridoxal phosphate-dependent aminotransferase [Clostridiales bacterium]